MSTEAFRRKPLIISGNSLSSGDHSTTFPSGGPDSLLRSYLIFVRDLRGQRREPSIELRSEDLRVLAAHLGVAEDLVLGGLLDLMGATRAQRSAMLAMLAAGALTLVLTGSFVSDLSSDGVSVEMARLADAVQVAVQRGEAGATWSTAAAPTVTAPAAPVRATPDTPTPDVLRSAGQAAARARSGSDASFIERVADTTADPTESVDEPGPVAGEPFTIAIAPDGSLVASVAPPVPTTSDGGSAIAELPDGTTVGVGAPPVPPASPPQAVDDGSAIAELPDGTTVGVGTPPVPPASPPQAVDDGSATAELPDGTTVGVGTPPIPPGD